MNNNIIVDNNTQYKKCSVTLESRGEDGKFIEVALCHGYNISDFIEKYKDKDIMIRTNSYTCKPQWSKIIAYEFTGRYYRIYTDGETYK